MPDQIALVHLKGEIDLHTCSLLRDTLRELIEQKFYQIVINLAEVPYLDSAALGVLVDAVRRFGSMKAASVWSRRRRLSAAHLRSPG